MEFTTASPASRSKQERPRVVSTEAFHSDGSSPVTVEAVFHHESPQHSTLSQQSPAIQESWSQLPAPAGLALTPSVAILANAASEFYWTVEWTQSMLDAYETHSAKYQDPSYKKKVIWQAIRSDMLVAMRHTTSVVPTLTQVMNKWKTLVAAYRRTEQHNSVSGNQRKECAFQAQLESLASPYLLLEENRKRDIIPTRPVERQVVGAASYEPLGSSLDSEVDADDFQPSTPVAQKRKSSDDSSAASATSASEPEAKKARTEPGLRRDLMTLQEALMGGMEQRRQEAQAQHKEAMALMRRMLGALERLVDKL